jgi:hypothetical protein
VNRELREKLREALRKKGYNTRDTALEYLCPRCEKRGWVFEDIAAGNRDDRFVVYWDGHTVDALVTLKDILSHPYDSHAFGCGHC